MAAAPKTEKKTKTATRPEPEERSGPQRLPESRAPSGGQPILNRKGEPVSLKIRGDEDRFNFDRSIIPAGWDYQWIAAKIYNWDNTQHLVNMYQNGWEPVPAERHDGMFMQKGHKGHIERDGMILCERDMRLTIESRKLDKQAADRQVAAAFQRAGMNVPSSITDFNHDQARQRTFVRKESQGFATQSEEAYQYRVDDE